ncbi:MAG: hypothetical protein AAGD10_16280 [Myxococcota bacterium]
MLRWVLAAAGLLFTAVLALAAYFFVAARSEAPAVALQAELTEPEVERLRALLARVDDPRERSGPQTLTLSQADVDAVFRFATSRVKDTGLQAQITKKGLRLQLSRVSPMPRLSPFVDLAVLLAGTPSSPELSQLRLGRLPLPDALLHEFSKTALEHLRTLSRKASELVEGVETVSFEDGEMAVLFKVSPELAERLERTGKELLTARVGPERLRAYHQALAELLQERPHQELAMAELVSSLFRRMRDRADPDARSELQVALLVGAMYAVGRSPNEIFDVRLSALTRRSVRLWSRSDLPKHFLVSAFVAAWGDRALADAVGLSKELSDAEAGGSGFSFVDLAADRAGTQLVERGLATPARTATLVRRLADPGLSNPDLLPDPRDLPEGLSEARLDAKGWAPGSSGHGRLVDEMDARLDATLLHRALLDSE